MNVLNKVTLESLKKNRTRTLVTIIGIILSAAMLTAVTTFIASLQGYMADAVAAQMGSWHIVLDDVTASGYETVKSDKEASSSALMKNYGYSAVDGSSSAWKKYVFICGFSDELYKLLPVYLTSGRLPENDGEIVIPDGAISNGALSLKIGDTVTFALGTRMYDGQMLVQNNTYNDGETLENTYEKTFTVVGFCDDVSFFNYWAAGYTAITYFNPSSMTAEDSCTAYIKVKNIYDVYKTGNRLLGEAGISVDYNSDLLRMSGVSSNSNYVSVFFGLGAFIIILIVVGSVALIYNSFSISVNERSKQFGLLSSVGASKKQIARSVMFEAFSVGIIGIPVGILCGIAGIGVTLYCLRGAFASMVYGTTGVYMQLRVSAPAIIIAAVIGFITIIISAFIPAKKAARISAIEAIRQSTTIVPMKKKKLRVSWFTKKILGAEGIIAVKNYKCSKSKYRSTVVSLTLSIILFVTATSFCDYLGSSAHDFSGTLGTNCDVFCSFKNYEEDKELYDGLMNGIAELDGVKQSAFCISNEDQYSEKHPTGYSVFDKSEDGYAKLSYNQDIMLFLCLDDAYFAEFAKTIGAENVDFGENEIILINERYQYSYDENKYVNVSFFDNPLGKTIELVKRKYTVLSSDDDGEGGIIESTDDPHIDLKVMAIADDAPLCSVTVDYQPTAIMSISSAKKLFGDNFTDIETNAALCMKATDAETLTKEIKKLYGNYGLSTESIYDVTENMRTMNNILLIINVFSYGFIILMALVSLSNIFNTISTNINLRRREFAMLRSVGMTHGSFNRMLDYECLLFGFKALLYGIPASGLLSLVIYRIILQGMNVPYVFPWKGVIISAVTVFVVVFLTMMYSMHKIQKENIVDVLKSDIT